MVIYWATCLVSIGITLFLRRCIGGTSFLQRHKWISAIICAFPLMLLSSLRYGIGSDYESYEQIYRLIGATMRNAHIYEPVFSYLIMFMNRLGLDFQWFIVFTSVVFLLLVYTVILEYSKSPCLSIYLLLAMTFFFQSTNIIRQMVACAICLYSIQYIKERKLISFIVCVLLAFGFHTSGILFLPAYFLYRKRFNIKFYIISIVTFFGASTLLSNYLRDIIVQLGSRLNNGYYLTYFETRGSNFGIVSFLINLLIFIWSSLFLDKTESFDQDVISDRADYENDMFLNFQFITVILSILNGSFPLINRFRFYYALPGIMLIPRTLYSSKVNGNNRLVMEFFIVVLFFAYCVFIEGYMNQSAAIPYVSIFNK